MVLLPKILWAAGAGEGEGPYILSIVRGGASRLARPTNL